MKFIREFLTSVLKNLIDENRNFQPKVNYYSSSRAWLKEIATVRLATHRQAGHTKAIKSLMKVYPNHLVVCPNDTMLYHYENGKRIITIKNINRILGSGMNIDTIFVDCAYFMSKSNLNELYDFVAKNLKLKGLVIALVE